MNYVGIDNGNTGACVVLDKEGSILFKSTLPIHRINVRDEMVKKLDSRKFFRMLKPYMPFIAIVEVYTHSPTFKTLVSMSDCFARILGTLELMGMEYKIVEAKNWQKMFWTKSKGVVDYCTKKEALRVASELWPKECWLATERSNKAHDGIVDAVLIAEYVRRNEGGS